MDFKARVDFKIIKGSETTFNEMENGSKLTQGNFTMEYEGGLTGKGELAEIKSYNNSENATILGLERVTGTLGEKSGSFVLEHIGKFEDGIITSKRRVIPGSATDDLQGLRGEVNFETGHAEKFYFIFNYTFV